MSSNPFLRINVRWILLAAALVVLPAAAHACPGCKEALFDPGQISQKVGTARGYALSIGLLLTVPFLLVAGFTVAIVRLSRRAPKSVPSSVDTPALSR